MNLAPYRCVRFFSSAIELRRSGETFLMRSQEPLGAYDLRWGDWLDHWGRESPDHTKVDPPRRPES